MRTTIAYCVPALSVGGVVKVAVTKPPEALLLKGSEAEARSAPVGRLLAAFLMEMTTLGGVPVQDEQKRSSETFVACPVTVGVKVWPNHDVLLKPNACVSVVLCASRPSDVASVTLPALVVGSVLVGTPAWKSAVVVSVRQPLVAALASEKSFVVVPPSGTAMVVAVAVVRPGKLAAIPGYLPAGTVNEYWPFASVVGGRLPSVTVAPAMGEPPGVAVTVPLMVPLPTVVHCGYLNEPTRVW